MLPPQVTMIPLYIFFRKLGWVNTFKPLVVPQYFGGGAANIFLLRQFYTTIPRELDDAARIDGCSNFGIYIRIMLPLARPALAAVAILSFVFHWQDFMGPLIYLDSKRYTLALGLRYFLEAAGSGGLIMWNWLMAVATLVMLPPVLVFFFSQRYFIQGIVITGVKG
jgi:multiple sugar transport system permease protein